jgi:hypothetical protein
MAHREVTLTATLGSVQTWRWRCAGPRSDKPPALGVDVGDTDELSHEQTFLVESTDARRTRPGCPLLQVFRPHLSRCRLAPLTHCGTQGEWPVVLNSDDGQPSLE